MKDKIRILDYSKNTLFVVMELGRGQLILIFNAMKKSVIAILYYLVACYLVLSIGQFAAANLSGTHFDTIVYLAVPAMSLVLLVRSIVKWKVADKASRWVLVVHVAGTLAVGVLVWYVWEVRG